MRKLSILGLGLWFWLVQPLWAQTPLTDPDSQTRNPEIGAFVNIEHWRPIQSVAGDLNGDGQADLAVALEGEDRSGRSGEERERTLMVLFATDPAGYALASRVPGLLPCSRCLGTLSKGTQSHPFDMEIEDGRLNIGWMAGSAEFKSVRLTFAYDRTFRTMALIADETQTLDSRRRTRTNTRHDYVTGITERNGKSAGESKRFIPIDAVSASQY